MRFFGNERIAFEVVVVPHLVDEVFAERKGHGRLARNDMNGGAQAVAVRDDRNVVQRSDGADAKKFRGATAPFRISLHDGKTSLLEVAFNFPSSVEVFAGCDGNGCAAMHDGEAFDLLGVSCFFDPV